MKLHGFQIEVGSKVWSSMDGWGTVKEVNDPEILVAFNIGTRLFTADGKTDVGGRLSANSVLYWRDYMVPNSCLRPPGIGFMIGSIPS